MASSETRPRGRSRRRAAQMAAAVIGPVLGGLGLTACTPPTGCTTNPSGSPVIVGPGQTVCLINVTVPGAVIVRPGGTLFMDGATVKGGVSGDGATSVTMCGSTVKGAVTMRGATGFLLLGGPDLAQLLQQEDTPCRPNTLLGGVTLAGNHSSVVLDGNQISGGVAVASNTGNPLLIGGNTIRGSLACSGNASPPFTFGPPNTVSGAETGQCAGL
ncbi:MAG TPA: hypothetical protein VGL20_19355 [Candidatus Dormibacteraeota bacterium]|jgi:hypothetical protein